MFDFLGISTDLSKTVQSFQSKKMHGEIGAQYASTAVFSKNQLLD